MLSIRGENGGRTGGKQELVWETVAKISWHVPIFMKVSADVTRDSSLSSRSSFRNVPRLTYSSSPPPLCEGISFNLLCYVDVFPRRPDASYAALSQRNRLSQKPIRSNRLRLRFAFSTYPFFFFFLFSSSSSSFSSACAKLKFYFLLGTSFAISMNSRSTFHERRKDLNFVGRWNISGLCWKFTIKIYNEVSLPVFCILFCIFIVIVRNLSCIQKLVLYDEKETKFIIDRSRHALCIKKLHILFGINTEVLIRSFLNVVLFWFVR